jgi:hypothetical protein
MGLFRRNKKEKLSELQGVPEGTFRCDVCKFVWPGICLCGAVLDGGDKPPKVYTLCGVCAIWLGFGECRFPEGLSFNLTDDQRGKVKALHRELEICGKQVGMVASTSRERFVADNVEGGAGLVHDFLEQVPNLRELLRLRVSMSPESVLGVSDRLTRGEFVGRSEVEKVNKG